MRFKSGRAKKLGINSHSVSCRSGAAMQPAEDPAAARVARLDNLYAKVYEEDSVRALTKVPHDPQVWVKVLVNSVSAER